MYWLLSSTVWYQLKTSIYSLLLVCAQYCSSTVAIYITCSY